MKRSVLHKDIFLSFRQSKGRFLSILCLMMLGAFGLVGLKAAGPDIERSASRYLASLNTMDLAVISDYGISEEDQKELADIKGAQTEYGYFVDTIIDESPQAIRVFSMPERISKYQLVEGRYPQTDGEVALLSSMKGRYKVGDRIQLNEEAGNDPLLRRHSFEVTGFVHSGELGSKTTFGSAASGSGTLSGYALTVPEAFDSPVYTLARLTFDDLQGLNSFGTVYQDRLKEHQQDLEKRLADNGKNRLAVIQQEAKSKMADGQQQVQEIRQQLAAVEKELSDGQSQIDQQQAPLSSAQGQITEKERELSSAAAQLDQANQTLAAVKTQLDAAAAPLAVGQRQLAETKSQLDTAAGQLSSAQKALEAGESQIAAGTAAVSQQEAALAAGEAELQAQMADLQAEGVDPAGDPTIAAAQAQLKQQQAQLDTARAQLSVQQEQFAAAEAQYQSQALPYQIGLEQYQAAEAEWSRQQAAYQAGLAQYQAGAASLAAKQQDYESGQQQLSQAKQELSVGQTQIRQAQTSLDEKKAAFEEKKESAEREIKTAEAALSQAQDEAAGLSLPSYKVYSRRTFPGDSENQMTAVRADGISSVGNVFPIVLYLVAALVTMTTMTRFVNEERINAGILRALGYDRQDVIRKFVIYGLAAGLLGTFAGVLAGMYLLPYILGQSLFESSTYPDLQLEFYWPIALIALLSSLLCSVLPALVIARRELEEKPAQLLLPKPPTAGSTILLERLGFLWRRLTFTQKVTARNIFRYKQRMFMTVFGVAGSVALLFAGLGITSSLSGIGERQFGQIIAYDMRVLEKTRLSQTERKDIQKLLDSKAVSDTKSIYSEVFSKKIGGVRDEQVISLFAADDGDFKGFVNLYDADSKEQLTLPKDGAAISQKLAELLKLSVGDSFELTSDAGKTYKIKVAAVSENYAGHFVFMNKSSYEQVFGQSLQENGYLVKLRDSSMENVQKMAADFMKETGVRTVVQNSDAIEQIEASVDSLGLVMQILTVVSILLALVILYNLTNINVAERIRELSTIKVLGFHNKEVTMYIYRETISLSLIGIAAGILLGQFLHRFLLGMIAPDAFLFNPTVTLSVYLIPIASIILILLALGYLVNDQLRRVDMLEALKSGD